MTNIDLSSMASDLPSKRDILATCIIMFAILIIILRKYDLLYYQHHSNVVHRSLNPTTKWAFTKCFQRLFHFFMLEYDFSLPLLLTLLFFLRGH